MTLAASVEVMQARRDEMPERAQAALDLLSSDVARFQGLVEDLLEISRFDAGAIRLHLEDLLVAEFVRQAVAVSSAAVHARRRVATAAEQALIRGDRRRLARVVANLIDNARAYGGGEPEISIADRRRRRRAAHPRADRRRGPRPGRARRGARRWSSSASPAAAVPGRRTGSDGAGLGLALVDEHVRMHGGRVWVEDRCDGESGARFVIELPATELDE